VKTIRQVADELGVSKDKIKYQVRKLPSNYLVKKGNITYLNEDGILNIRDLMLGKTMQNSSVNNQVNIPSEENEIYKILKSELEAKNKLIDEQQQSINKLTAALERTTASLQAAQMLHGGTMHKQLLDDGQRSPHGEVEHQPKRKFLQRIFGK